MEKPAIEQIKTIDQKLKNYIENEIDFNRSEPIYERFRKEPDPTKLEVDEFFEIKNLLKILKTLHKNHQISFEEQLTFLTIIRKTIQNEYLLYDFDETITDVYHFVYENFLTIFIKKDRFSSFLNQFCLQFAGIL